MTCNTLHTVNSSSSSSSTHLHLAIKWLWWCPPLLLGFLIRHVCPPDVAAPSITLKIDDNQGLDGRRNLQLLPVTIFQYLNACKGIDRANNIAEPPCMVSKAGPSECGVTAHQAQHFKHLSVLPYIWYFDKCTYKRMYKCNHTDCVVTVPA